MRFKTLWKHTVLNFLNIFACTTAKILRCQIQNGSCLLSFQWLEMFTQCLNK